MIKKFQKSTKFGNGERVEHGFLMSNENFSILDERIDNYAESSGNLLFSSIICS